jgi:hypothetical protein
MRPTRYSGGFAATTAYTPVTQQLTPLFPSKTPTSMGNDWAIETKLTLGTGTDEILNFQQGGLVAHGERRHDRRAAGRNDVPADRPSLRHDPQRARTTRPDQASGRRMGDGRSVDVAGQRAPAVGLESQGRQTGDRKTSRFAYLRSFTG